MKKSFVLYLDQYSSIKKLSDEQAGMLLKAMFEFNLGNEFEIIDPVVDMAFSFLGETFKRDSDKYLKICEKNKENARKRWDKKNATASDRISKNAKHADSDSESDSDSDSESESEMIVIDKPNNFKKPSIKEIEDYCLDRNFGLAVNPQEFINHYEANDWTLGKTNKPMKRWKQCVNTWNKNALNRDPSLKPKVEKELIVICMDSDLYSKSKYQAGGLWKTSEISYTNFKVGFIGDEEMKDVERDTAKFIREFC